MDLETENRIAAMLMKEAAELRDKLRRKVFMFIFSSLKLGSAKFTFLTATVRGVQQANRAAEVNEMWRVRQKELELDDKLKGSCRDKTSTSSSSRGHEDCSISINSISRSVIVDKDAPGVCTSSRRRVEDCDSCEDGLRDEEIEDFLHSRVKRGRGAVGSRMDETGPYPQPSCTDSKGKLLASTDVRVNEEWEHHVLGPEKPAFLKSHEPPPKDDLNRESWKKSKVGSESSSKGHSKKHRSKDESKRKKMKEKKHKHHKKS